ncbi:hypothetical protein SL617_25110, partial [Klebsiella michiganensis]
IGPDPRNFNQRVSLGRNDLLIRTFLNYLTALPKVKISLFTYFVGDEKGKLWKAGTHKCRSGSHFCVIQVTGNHDDEVYLCRRFIVRW